MARRFEGAQIDLVVRLKSTDIQRELEKVEKGIKSLGVASRTSMFAAGLAVGGFLKVVHKVGKQIRHFAQTIKSAIFRTLAYGMINVFRNTVNKIKQDIKEASKVSLNLARAATIMSKGGEDTAEVYQTIRKSVYNTNQALFLTSRGASRLAVDLAKGGLAGQDFQKMMDAVSRAVAITGENASTLGLDLLRMAQAFGISSNQYDKFVDIVTVGSTLSVGTIRDLLEATKYLAPVMVMAYGKGLESVKKFVAALMTMTAAGAKGGTASRWLRRAMLEMLAPTSRTLGLLTKYGVELYEGSGRSRKYAYELYKIHRRTEQLYESLSKLTDKELVARRRGDVEAANKIRERIDLINDQIKAEEELATRTFAKFTAAGGRLRPLDEIVKTFRDLVQSGKITEQELAALYRGIYQIRGAQGLQTLTVQFDKLIEINKKLNEAMGRSTDMVQRMLEQWGPQFKTLANSIEKINYLLADTFAEPVLGPVAKSIRENIINPISDAILNNKQLASSLEGVKKRIESTIKPLTKDIGEFFKVYLEEKPGAQKSKKLEELSHKIKQKFEPFINVLKSYIKDTATNLGNLFANLFRESFFSALSTMPIIGRLFTREARLKSLVMSRYQPLLLASKSPISYVTGFKQWGMPRIEEEAWRRLRLAYEGKFEELPASIREQAKRARFLMQLYGIKPAEQVGKWEKINSSLKQVFKETQKFADEVTSNAQDTINQLRRASEDLTRVKSQLREIRELLNYSEQLTSR